MRKKNLALFFLGFLLGFFLFFVNIAKGQGTLATFKKKPQKLPVRMSVENYSKDANTEKQKLFNVLKELNQVKGTFFLFSDKADGDILVSPISDYSRPVEEILEQLLRNTDLQFKKIGQKTFVILSPVKEPLQDAAAAGNNESADQLNQSITISPAASHLIRGKVITAAGIPMSNVSVIIKGTSKGIVTAHDGSFSIEGTNGDVLEFSFVGYEKKQSLVSDENKTMIAQLSVIDQPMDEVVVTSLGVTKSQKSLGYAVSTITSEEITSSGNTNFASALYGKAAGVKITTSPGGATSAVQVQVRGLNSLNFNTQPLYVVDGIIIRNTNEKGLKGVNNFGYWDDPRIRGNGILDINPYDIESLTILKGASATALYGSEAASGVVVITTKKGSPKKRLGLEVNYISNVEQAAFLPKYQNVYGPGYDRTTNLSEGATEEGWIPTDTDGDGKNESLRPNFRAYAQFGPKMEGQLVPWWDGQLHRYSPQPDNYKNFYRSGFNSLANVAVSNRTDKSSYRISYTRNDYKGIQVGGSMARNTFNINSAFKVNEKLTTDVVVSYVNSKVHNRPYQLQRIIAAYAGFFSRAEDIGVMFDKYKTNEGYKWVPWNQSQRNPAEALNYDMKSETLDFLWNQLRNSENEDQNRLLSSATLNYQVSNNLQLRGRIGNDLTSLITETKNFNEYPLAYNGANSTGFYGVLTGRYSIIYGDLLLTYSKKLNKTWSLAFNGGIQSRDEKYNDQSSTTSGGLIKENWFSLNNSFGPAIGRVTRSAIFKYAYLGFFDISYKDYLYVEGTARKEYSSTLPPGSNSYFYPSVNASFIFTEALKMPSFMNYGKLRASYGVVGNAPPAYASGIAYTQSILPTINGPVASLNGQINAGNNNIRPENKYEMEFGMEMKMFHTRFGIDLTYYNSRTIDQILQLTVPASSGAISKLVNAGELQSSGLELGVNIMAVAQKYFKWHIRMNLSAGQTRVRRLSGAVKEIVYYEGEQNAIRIVAEEGKNVGNIYVYPKMKDASGNDIIGSNGLYVIDNSKYTLAGNVMPKIIGGVANTFVFGSFSFDVMIDYRFGGKLVSPVLKYNIGAGMYESSLQYRDEAHGGLSYFVNGSGQKVLLNDPALVAPDGSKVYHDGIILKGNAVDGKANTAIVDAAYYYINMFGWGAAALNEEGSIYNNDYLKLREAVIGYTLPVKIANNIHFNNIRISLVGRNLFYLLRSVKNVDPEAPIGTNWTRQSVDEGTLSSTRSYGFSVHFDF
ncbi:MAG: SusC/RagA family TonB-linked outer membrane protein [Flavitalea sp.]